MKRKRTNTSWETSSNWYKKCVGDKGHYYHQKIILPEVLKILKAQKKMNLDILDLACGQGILERALPKNYNYCGLDLSSSFIEYAEKNRREKKHKFLVADATKKLPISNSYDIVCIILALQNIEYPQKVFDNAYQCLKKGGKFIAVINHPYFRIPKQSSWEVDEKKKVQFRKIESYMSPQKIPIQTHPSKSKNSPLTYSYHNPLHLYFALLSRAGFCIETIQEWCSPKTSTGSKAKMENRARKEFPLFMSWTAKK